MGSLLLRPCSKVQMILMQLSQIARTVQKEMKNQLFGNGEVVLGLATSHDFAGTSG